MAGYVIVKGAKSVEVRPVGISKGLAMSRIINAIAAREAHEAVQYDFVLVAGHFLVRDENIFTFFEGQSLKASPSALHLHPTAQHSRTHTPKHYSDGKVCTMSPMSMTMSACRQDDILGHCCADVQDDKSCARVYGVSSSVMASA